MLNRFSITMLVALMAFTAGAGSASAALSDVPTPAVSGPVAVTPTSHPFLATDIDLEKYGYVEEEFFIEGDAFRYDTTGAANQTATKITTGGANDDGAFPFKTRIVVRRPANPADFNGTVLAEWYNVTALYDLEANWFGDPYYPLKNGYAFVGVSAQTTGINALKSFDNDRYGDLTVNGNGAVVAPPDNDALSYDIFSSALKAVKGAGTGPDPMGSLDPEMIIASGESQSCGRLVNHYNKVQPIHEIVDAYLLTVCSTTLRTDRPEKAIRVLSETENRTQRTDPDNASYRHWEVAGGSHIPAMARTNWEGPVERDKGNQVVECQKLPLSKVEWPFVQNRAIAGLVDWTNGGDAPPIAPRGEYVTPTELVRNGDGIAQGAIRLPSMDVPTAVNTGTNDAAEGAGGLSIFCRLLGSSEVFSEETMSTKYRDHADYVDQASAAADAVGEQGFVLPEDVARLKQIARNFAEIRPTAPVLSGDQLNRGSFGLAWRGTDDSLGRFRLESKNAKGDWAPEDEGVVGKAKVFDSHAEGTFDFRVRSETVIPATSITAERVAITPFSETLSGVRVDRTGPRAPVITAARKPDTARGGGWYRGPVKVTAKASADPALPDGTPGSGLDPASVTSLKRTISASGKTVVTVPATRDMLGNVSPIGRRAIQIDRRKPTIKVSCPKRAVKGKRAFVRVRAKDGQSGVAGKANRKIRINTKRSGRTKVLIKVSDRVGNKATKTCSVRVR